MDKRFIKCTLKKDKIKTPTKIDENGTLFTMYTPKRFFIRPGKFLTLSTNLIVELQKDLFVTVSILPMLQSKGLRLENK